MLLVVVVSILVFLSCAATRRIMVEIRCRELLTKWDSMSNTARDELLRDRCWRRRCLCRRYGYPWKRPMAVIGRDGRVHECERCYPIMERL